MELGKACKECGEFKILNEFPKDKKMKDGYKNKCNICVNKKRVKRYSENINEHRDKNRVHDAKRRNKPDRKEYVKNNKIIERKCIYCDNYFITNKYSDKKKCDKCIQFEKIEIKLIKYFFRQCEIAKKQHIKEEKQHLKQERKLIISSRTKQCDNCGKQYKPLTNNSKYCEQCRKKINNRYKEISRGKRYEKMKINGKVDRDITIEKLINRDGYGCYLCGCETNFEDYETTKEGYFITGSKYPTIEHVVAINNGGTHTWNNVKVACFECNTKKGTNNAEEYIINTQISNNNLHILVD